MSFLRLYPWGGYKIQAYDGSLFHLLVLVFLLIAAVLRKIILTIHKNKCYLHSLATHIDIIIIMQ